MRNRISDIYQLFDEVEDKLGEDNPVLEDLIYDMNLAMEGVDSVESSLKRILNDTSEVKS